MLGLHKRKHTAKTPAARAKIEEEIARTDREIDNIVYELYRPTAEDIKVVEGAG